MAVSFIGGWNRPNTRKKPLKLNNIKFLGARKPKAQNRIRHDIIEILLKVALNTTNQTKPKQDSQTENQLKTNLYLFHLLSVKFTPYDFRHTNLHILMPHIKMIFMITNIKIYSNINIKFILWRKLFLMKSMKLEKTWMLTLMLCYLTQIIHNVLI